MARISERSAVYLVGFSVVGVGIIIFVIGFATPNWVESSFVSQRRSMFGSLSMTSTLGLWQACTGTMGISTCFQFIHTSFVHDMVRALECIAIVLLAGFAFIAVVNNFTTLTDRNTVWFNRLLTFLGITGGLIGIIGAVVFVTAGYSMEPSWSFGLVVSGCCLVVIGTIMMACSVTSLSGSYPGNRRVLYQTSQYPVSANQPQVHVVSSGNQWNQPGQNFAGVQSYYVSGPATG